MKNWKITAASLLAASVLTACLALPATAASATNENENAKSGFRNGAVIPASQSEAAREAARETMMAKYYIIEGSKLNKAVARLESLAPEKSGLDASQPYFYRMDKALAGNYFYHVKAFAPDKKMPAGEYFLARDKSCVFRRYPEDGSVELLEGNTEKLLKKVEIYPASVIIPLHGSGKVLVRVPGNMPCNITLTSLKETIATVAEENGQLLIRGNARGYADILTEVEIGGFVKTAKIRFAVMDNRDIEAYEARRAYYVSPPVFIGIGWGWGGPHHPGPPPGPRGGGARPGGAPPPGGHSPGPRR